MAERWAVTPGRRGVLDPPVIGSFAADAGTFLGSVTTATPRWEQAFSVDGGKTWETNWTMDFTREAAQP